MNRLPGFILIFTFFMYLSSCRKVTSESGSASLDKTPVLDFVYLESYPHDTNSFTEGLLIQQGELYESTGATRELPQTKSLFGILDLKTGKIDPKVCLDPQKYFGEGISFLKDKVYQLTYKTRIGFIYDAQSFKKLSEFSIPSVEGWGLTTDGHFLIMSDGTSMLTYLDPEDLRVVKRVSVTENGCLVENLNELEWIRGLLYANIWTTTSVVLISPTDGKVVAKLDLASLAEDAKNSYQGSLEMNGIAYDSTDGKIYVTGKMWPKIYAIKVDK
jgi:glutaminyl-peptide cyclotransferase